MTPTVEPQVAAAMDRVRTNRPLSLALRPSGRFVLMETSGSLDGEGVDAAVAAQISDAFASSEAEGLLHLAAAAADAALPASLAYGRRLSEGFLRALVALDERSADASGVHALVPTDAWIGEMAESVPPMLGGELVDTDVVGNTFGRLADYVMRTMAEEGLTVGQVLERLGGDWHALGRVWFHLAENKDDPERPFAFLASYTPIEGVGGPQRARHRPLGQALKAFSAERETLVRLLEPVRRAAERSDVFRSLLDSGELFHPLAWTAEQAYAFLDAAETLEGTGVMLRLPKSWSGRRPGAPRVDIRIGETAAVGVGAMLSFDVGVALDGEILTDEEAAAILEGTSRLAWLRGRWVDVNPAELRATLQQWSDRSAQLSLSEGLRLLADPDAPAHVRGGQWLEHVAARLRDPRRAKTPKISRRLKAKLRPYQKEGVAWLRLLYDLGLGGVLADDMGLGKTVQVIALILGLKDQKVTPSLVVVPASLLGNWRAELVRFAPTLNVAVAHRSVRADIDEIARLAGDGEVDVVLTTYGTVGRVEALLDVSYAIAVLDEAQAIKNPSTRQAKTAKKISARCRLALTGTPIENDLGDLWSLYDFINPGLLGSPKAFRDFVARLGRGPGYGPLRRLIRPYMLRRLKTDRRIISDLPDKTEVNVYCALSKKQASLYGDSVDALAKALATATPTERRGMVFAFLTRFKQICNHPSHWLGDGDWSPLDSGKLLRLRDLAEAIAARQEKLLVFTQYREATAPLAGFLEDVFGQRGLILHGGVPVKQRPGLVKAFQDDDGPPFFVLSLKAGGTGLNLTAASHVVHFDRWWNPAVENQATDRAYRIGQHRNVLVHRFVCSGTLEERIDKLLEKKQVLSTQILASDGERKLTELSDTELLDLVRLDVTAARSLEG